MKIDPEDVQVDGSEENEGDLVQMGDVLVSANVEVGSEEVVSHVDLDAGHALDALAPRDVLVGALGESLALRWASAVPNDVMEPEKDLDSCCA